MITVASVTGERLPGFPSSALIAVCRQVPRGEQLAYRRADGAWLPTRDDPEWLRSEGYPVAVVVLVTL